MTSHTIEAGQTSTTFTLGVGSYNVTAVAGKYATISQAFTIGQADIEIGSKEVDLGTMQFGTHTFNVSVACDDDGEFTVGLYQGANLIESKQTINKSTAFTVTATENGDAAYEYEIRVTRDGYKTVSETVNATQAEFRLNAGESVPLTAGSNVLVLTVRVVANASVDVTVQ